MWTRPCEQLETNLLLCIPLVMTKNSPRAVFFGGVRLLMLASLIKIMRENGPISMAKIEREILDRHHVNREDFLAAVRLSDFDAR